MSKPKALLANDKQEEKEAKKQAKQEETKKKYQETKWKTIMSKMPKKVEFSDNDPEKLNKKFKEKVDKIKNTVESISKFINNNGTTPKGPLCIDITSDATNILNKTVLLINNFKQKYVDIKKCSVLATNKKFDQGKYTEIFKKMDQVLTRPNLLLISNIESIWQGVCNDINAYGTS